MTEFESKRLPCCALRALLLATVATSPLAYADPAALEGPDQSGGALQEIVVTARKTTERLQDIPMSIAVVTSEGIEKTGAITLEDLGREVPGLNIVSAAPGQNMITLRGLSGNNTVGFYLDDTPLSVGIGNAVQASNFDMDPALFDLDRVEVLRGPQGTLYGASSFGGTVRYITNQPNLSEPHVAVKTTLSDTVGGGFNQEIDALVNQPLIPGYAAVRAMVFERDNSGYIDRYPTDPNNYLAVLPGPIDRNINTEHTHGGRIAIEAKPTDSFSATLAAYYQHMDLGGQFTFDSPPGSFSDPIQSRLVPEPSTDRVSLYTLTLQGDVRAVHITSSTSYLDRYVFNAEDDSKSLNYFYPQPQVYPSTLYAENGNHDFVQEVRGSGSVGPVHGVAGLFYAHAVTYGTLNWPTTPNMSPALAVTLFTITGMTFSTFKRRHSPRSTSIWRPDCKQRSATVFTGNRSAMAYSPKASSMEAYHLPPTARVRSAAPRQNMEFRITSRRTPWPTPRYPKGIAKAARSSHFRAYAPAILPIWVCPHRPRPTRQIRSGITSSAGKLNGSIIG